MKLEGIQAVVTGAASGLGRATAAALIANGVRVGMVDLPGERLDVAARELGGVPCPADVTNAADVEGMIQQFVREVGPLHAAINCAGIGTAARIVGRNGAMPLQDFMRTITVNLGGTFNILRTAAAAMMANEPNPETGERGVIINTASIAAYDGQIGQAAYAASKAGVAGLTLPAARELAGSGIRVMCIAPGIFRTPMLAGLPEAAQQSLGQQVPFPARLGDPEEYAFLATHILQNVMLNGEVIRLDGALRMAPR
jgi:NAD(P)-dependent dehydrogenase (short-subunit alcohol dehydrogenase family)